jgi:hypothetical protein
LPVQLSFSIPNRETFLERRTYARRILEISRLRKLMTLRPNKKIQLS